MIRKFLKMSFLVEIEPVVSNGKGVWRATSPSLKMFSESDTPDGAVSKLQEALQLAENSSLEKRKESQVVKREALEREEESKVDTSQSTKEVAEVDLKLLGKKALKELALARGFAVTPNMTKPEVIKLMTGHETDATDDDTLEFE